MLPKDVAILDTACYKKVSATKYKTDFKEPIRMREQTDYRRYIFEPSLLQVGT